MDEGYSSHVSQSGYTLIKKNLADLRPPPQLFNYDRECAEFSWEKARALLGGLPGGKGLNIAHEAVDRHIAGPNAGKVALRWLGKSGERRDITYRELRVQTNRFVNGLKLLGVQPGERVFVLMGRRPNSMWRGWARSRRYRAAWLGWSGKGS